VERLSEARNSLNGFSSAKHVAAKHEAQSLETIHEFMQQASYVNMATGKSGSVIYGLDLDQVKFMEAFWRMTETLSVSPLPLEDYMCRIHIGRQRYPMPY
jgi:hypothetical protein